MIILVLEISWSLGKTDTWEILLLKCFLVEGVCLQLSKSGVLFFIQEKYSRNMRKWEYWGWKKRRAKA